MRKSTKNLTLITCLLLIASPIFANSYITETHKSINPNGLAINIIQQDQEQIKGQLIHADAAYLVFENPIDEAVQLIPRTEVQILETNLEINLFTLLKNHDPEELTDTIELNDGTRIACIILDISSESVQYFTGKSLKRSLVSTHNIYMLYLSQNSINIPFPVIAANAPAL